MIQKLKTIISILGLLVIIISFTTIHFQHLEINRIQNELSISKSNEKAFALENSKIINDNIAFKFTIDQLNYFNDSLTDKINNVRKELKIKDKDLKQMQYLLSVAQKTDTIRLRDTIFIDKSFKLDSLIGDDWYNLRLGLEYPNIITTTPTFRSEKYIILNNKKETINPPKKFGLFRLFQKKHNIVEINIVEKNPYIDNKQQRFIEIIK